MKAQLIGGILAAIVAVVVWLISGDFPGLPEGHPGPGLFPRAIAIGLLLGGVFLIVQALRADRGVEVERHAPVGAAGGVGRVAAVVVVLLLYPLLNDLVGFVPTVSAACFLVALLLRARPLASALTAVGGTVVIYFVFTQLLGVPI